MTLLLLDTTFLVDVERAGHDLDDAIDDEDDVAIAAVTVAELFVGVELSKSKRQRTAREEFVTEVLEVVDVISYDAEIARSHALLLVAVRSAGRPRGAHDLIIAATAHATARTVVTADVTAFADLPSVEFRGPT